jgi:hypothetical protein
MTEAAIAAMARVSSRVARILLRVGSRRGVSGRVSV